MADIDLGGLGNSRRLVRFDDVAAALSFQLDFSGSTTANLQCMTDGGESVVTAQADMDELHLKVNLANSYSISGVSFVQNATRYVAKGGGQLHRDPNTTTGNGTIVGAVSPPQGLVVLDQWVAGSSPAATSFRGGADAPVDGPFTPFGGYEVMFRTAAAPLRSGSLSVQATMMDGTVVNSTADTDGVINATRVKGKVNYSTGVVDLFFVHPTGAPGQETVDLSFLEISGVSDVYLDRVRIETIRYNAVAYAYLPLDADVLGIDPVRLPSDGRVPIFRPGTIAVVGNTQETSPATVSNGQTINTGRVRLSRVRVVGNDGNTINTGYDQDLEAGTVTFTNVSGYSQPVHIEHRIEDMVQVRDAQINGEITFVPALSHDYPAGSSISSALIGQDLTARVSLLFDQATWDGITWSDVQGTPAPGTYNDTANPIELSNAGTETERWAIRFTNTTSFQCYGEHVGLIDVGVIGADFSPINPVTNEPYFTIRKEGWGLGWTTGNMLRFNTVGARFPVWVLRTIKQGPATGDDYSFTLLVRGDVDNPIA